MLTRLIDTLLEATLIAGLFIYAAGGVPPVSQGTLASIANVGVSPWNGPGEENVTTITGCYGPSIPARDDLAPNAPYKQYWIPQYMHGCDYGHAAIDFKADGDSTVLSPINGCVIANTYDGVGNTVLKIENEQYVATLLHGDYTVAPPDCVRRGQKVGNDASNGNSSGPHTHLSIYDRLVGHNAHPLALIK